MKTVNLWKITEKDKPQLINKAALNLESRLEKWITEDISIISKHLIVIGTQVTTNYHKFIDILAMNQNGELVIIELKRDKTYREVIAQGLDYATWVKDLDYEDINKILNKYHSDNIELSEYFGEKFDLEIEEFNSDHKILIVGSEIDDSTTRIIEYLSSEPYNVNINALSFNYFKNDEGNEFLAQSFVLSESQITEESVTKKRRREPSIVKILFQNNRLEVGQKLIFKPAQDKGLLNTEDFTVTIENKGTHCAKRAKDKQCYSLSKLRRLIAEELGLKEVKKYWGFGVRYDWLAENNKNLEDLRQEINSI